MFLAGARPPVQTMMQFIDDHRGGYGGEPICKTLPIAPSTYYARLAERHDSNKLAALAKRDVILKPEIDRVFKDNRKVYGVRKIWHQLRREGHTVARCCRKVDA